MSRATALRRRETTKVGGACTICGLVHPYSTDDPEREWAWVGCVEALDGALHLSNARLADAVFALERITKDHAINDDLLDMLTHPAAIARMTLQRIQATSA